jgi:hypothetical protein
MNLHLYLAFQVACLIVMSAGVRVCGQDRGSHAFNQVPEPSRTQLVGLLHQYLEFEKHAQYERLFQMLYETANKQMTSTAYAAYRQKTAPQRGVIEEFVPDLVMDVTLRDGDVQTYTIRGRAKVRLQSHTTHKEMSLSARFENGAWKFSELFESYLHE